MRTGVIIQKKAGQLIPSEFLETALKNNPNGGGYIIQDKEEDGDPCLITESGFDKSPTLAQIEELQAEYKDNAMLLWLGNGKFNEKSAQPFVITSAEGPAVLACMLEGDFSKYVDTKSDDSDERRVFDQVIEPLLNKAWKYAQAEGTYEAFINELDSTFEQSLMNAASHRCVFAFMPAIGDPIAFGNNELGEVYEWGTVSNKYDYGTVSQTPASTTKKKGGWWSKSKGEAAPAATPSPEPAKEDKPGIVAPAPGEPGVKTDTALPAATLKGHWEPMPDTVKRGGHQAQKAWIRKLYGLGKNGQLPEGWRNQSKFFVPDQKIKSFVELKAMMEGAEIVETEPKDMKADEPVKVEAKAEAKATPAKATQPTSGKDIKEQRKNEANLMTLSVEEQTKASTSMATFLDYKSQGSPNPMKTKEMEAKYPKFTEKVPISFNEMLLITPEQWAAFQKDNPKAFMMAFLEMKNAFLDKADIKLEDLIPAPGKEDTPATKPAEKPAEAPVAAPAAKKGGFSSMFKKTA